ncbi:5'/3'-nucleotidase SurE [Paractinoplanes globisporus]|uniref:5'-nucleotidase n=1 Tax=Paractinoplanes globisporus TaxID=113565 RepID=A0ABW6WAU5_9ACTN|nr:5'/3'-nucleotidase SurE [Actinoplanes globisporus]
MRILITNDDGIASPGLEALATAVREAGHEVVVAAPSTEYSGMSASLQAVTTEGRVLIEQTPFGYAVPAAPAFIVVLATLGVFGDVPDLVLSGINPGANAGRAVLHSGTVGAALTAVARGRPAMAVSLDYLAADGPNFHWATAAATAVSLIGRAAGAAPGVALNLNVPNRPSAPVVRPATLAAFGRVQIALLESGDDFVHTDFLRSREEPAPGSDLALLAEGYATLTPVRPPAEASEAAVPHQRRPPSDRAPHD